MVYVADLNPNYPINIGTLARPLQTWEQSLPGIPEWQYIHTPGHSPFLISFWREQDKTLIAGDAFVTTKQESAITLALQTKVISGPLKYFTFDWQQAEQAVKNLLNLAPEIVATGHGMSYERTDYAG